MPLNCMDRLILRWFVSLLVMVFALHASAFAERRGRFNNYSVLPFAELQPGFTSDPRQTFTLDIGGIGREPIDIVAVTINDRELPDNAWRTQLSQLTVTPDSDLRIGLNRVTVRYNHRVDRVHRESENPVVHTFFVNHQREGYRIEFGERGELIVDGRRIFVRGGYRSGQVDAFVDALPSAVEAGFNLVHEYRFETYDLGRLGVERFVEDARTYLRRAHRLGLGVFLGLPRAATREFDDATLANVVAELANEPALWMWYIYDEPSSKTLTPEKASRVYDLLHRLDPARPAIILTNTIAAMSLYHPFCDVLWYDRYPIVSTSDELTSLAPGAAVLQKSLQSVTPGKPVWPVLQLYDGRGIPSVRKSKPDLPAMGDEMHRPNEAEIRAQAHVSIAQKTMAVVYYWVPEGWYSMKANTPGVWKSLSRVLHELRDIEPALLSNEQPPVINVSGGHDKVMMWTRLYRGQVYVGLANASIHTPAQLAIQSPIEGGRVRQLFGDGHVESAGDEVKVRLGSAGVVVLAFRSP